MRCVMVAIVFAFIFLFMIVPPELNVHPPEDGDSDGVKTKNPTNWN